MQYLQVLFEAACFSEHFDTFWHFGVKANRGGHKKNGFPQIVISSKLFKTMFMSCNIDLGSMNPFPVLKLQFSLLLF